MSEFTLFMKGNKKIRENTKYKATKSLSDEKGQPLDWEIRPLTTEENDNIRDECTIEVQVQGKPGQYRQKLLTSKYISKMISSCVVYPDLNNKSLQDSYGVTKPEDLIRRMVDDPSEYNDFAVFIQDFNGFDKTIDDDIEKAKN